MNEDSPVIVLASRGLTVKPTVEKRVERRLEVLREWDREGVPSGSSIPRSLNQARLWDDSELGILPILSPNEFTQNHPVLGGRVREIACLLTKLGKRHEQPKGKRKPRSKSNNTMSISDHKVHDRQLQAAVSQWHSERDQALAAMRRAEVAEARCITLLEENATKDRLIADLREQLTRRDGLRSVK